jgi:transcriptional regulator with XRE-family HTH domain
MTARHLTKGLTAAGCRADVSGSLAGQAAWPSVGVLVALVMACRAGWPGLAVGVVVVREADEVAALRRGLGRQLAERRKLAGYAQREFGALVGYSRTAVANAEGGHARIGRQFWERADRVLGTGELFARGYDRLQMQVKASARTTASAALGQVAAGSRPALGLEPLTLGSARQLCRDRGWPVEEDRAGRLWLVTGTVIDALEVPRAAGMVAAAWWLYTRGVPDEIRGLPALPDPAVALAVIAAGPRCYFLAPSGACPWTRADLSDDGARSVAAVRWHAGGSRVPAPPSPLGRRERAVWAHIPSPDGQLVSPMALLHVLAQAVAATRDPGSLLLPGGVRAVLAVGGPFSAESGS